LSALSQRLAGQRVVICAGAGGVGKTTVSAAVALGLAAQGRRVAVVTIDPAHRLAEALGLGTLGNLPAPVDPAPFASAGLDLKGELWAMMLDVKRTFDEVIVRLAPTSQVRDEILANRIYGALSTTVAGSQEYTAIAKLFDLASGGQYDVIVLDTPPSRSAIDFLRAPDRLIGFLEGGAMAALVRPTGHAVRTAAFVLGALRRITGFGLLDDLGTFFTLFGGLQESLSRRAADVGELLRDPSTSFLIVTSTELTPLEEAIFFAAELEKSGMRHSAVVINRLQPLDSAAADVAVTALRLKQTLGASLAHRVALTHAELQVLARRDHAAIERLREALHEPHLVCLTDRAADVQATDELIDLQRELFASAHLPAVMSVPADVMPTLVS
jgi:anion-transporting  ArsA/GET3 family ATPase